MINEDIKNYIPRNEQEERDRAVMLRYLSEHDDAFLRENETAHFTASSWIVNGARSKVLLAYHKIYDSWAWTGGHADGERDLLKVALREAAEETGIEHIFPVDGKIASLEILTVDGHMKRGKYVPSHLHLNVTYLLTAEEGDKIRAKEDENSSVGWFTLDQALKAPSEPWMVERVYKKLNDAVLKLK